MIKQFYFNHRCDPKKVKVLPVKVDLGVMVMRGILTLPKVPELEPHHQMFECHLLAVGVLSFCRDEISIFYICWLILYISEIRNHYHFLHIANYSIHHVSVIVLSGLLRVPFVVLDNLPEILNLILYLNHKVRLFSFWHQLLFVFFITIRSRTRDWTHNLQAVIC